MERQYSHPWEDYELLDAGGGKKLERFGSIVTIRPELQAYFRSGLPFAEWEKRAHWEFVETSTTKGSWRNLKPGAAKQWPLRFGELTIQLELTKFKHVGIFPEQESNWRFIADRLGTGQRFLNLFAYTGVASLVAAHAGAEVLHVDSVRHLVTMANENMVSSHLSGIKWVVEDALRFAQREARRGNRYDGIVMDPPAFGLGAKGEKWILEDKLPALLEAAAGLLRPGGFLVVNTYSPKLTATDLQRIASDHFAPGTMQVSELWMKTGTGKDLFYGNILKVVL